MSTLFRTFRRVLVAIGALLLSGCGRESSLQWIFDHKVEIRESEREALRALFHSVDPEDVELMIDQNPKQRYLRHSLRVIDGHVTALELPDGAAGSELSSFPQLQKLILRGVSGQAWQEKWPRLRELRIESSALETLPKLAECCPELQTLSLVHVPIADLRALEGALKLQSLRLEHTAVEDLQSAPAVPSLERLVVSSGPLASLRGLGSFENLETLGIYGAKSLRDLDSLPPLAKLRELDLEQNGLTSLALRAELPRLESLTLSDNRLLSLRLPTLESLQRLEVHEKSLLAVELATSPHVKEIDLEGQGRLFKRGGCLRELSIAEQPDLERLNLRHHHLQHLQGLAPQPKLWELLVDHNPIAGTERLEAGFPALRHVSIRGTRVAEISPALEASAIVFSFDPAEIEANAWEAVLREAFEAQKHAFVERLPAGGGSARHHQSRCSFRIATFATPQLRCAGSLDAVSGLVEIPLVNVDPLSPGAGTNDFPIRVSISTRRGTARAFVKYELDIRGQAEALAGYSDRTGPLFAIGEKKPPEDFKKGFTVAEARPGRPDSAFGEAHHLVDRLVIWIEGEGAEGVDYVVESPGLVSRADSSHTFRPP